MLIGVYRCLQVFTGAYMDIGHRPVFEGVCRCPPVLIGVCRWAPVGTGGRCLVIFKSAKTFAYK